MYVIASTSTANVSDQTVDLEQAVTTIRKQGVDARGIFVTLREADLPEYVTHASFSTNSSLIITISGVPSGFSSVQGQLNSTYTIDTVGAVSSGTFTLTMSRTADFSPSNASATFNEAIVDSWPAFSFLYRDATLQSVPSENVYPADRCTWHIHTAGDRSGYLTTNATFYDGSSATGTAISNPRFGYIGKSGRFVELSN